jgi:thioredoxin 1
VTASDLGTGITPLTRESDLTDALQAAEADGAAVLVDFTATWCSPCRHLHPELERYAGEVLPAIRTLSVDVDEHPDLTVRYGVSRFPTLLLFAHGEPVLLTSEPRTVDRLHEVFDDLAVRALAAPPAHAYPLGSGEPIDESMQPRQLALPAAQRPGVTVTASPRTAERRGAMMLSAAASRPHGWELTLPSDWHVTVAVNDAELDEADVNELLAGFADEDVEELVLVLRQVPDALVAELRRFARLRALRVESQSLVGRDLEYFAALASVRQLDLNTMGDAVDPAQLDRLRARLPETIVNGTWMAAHLIVRPGSEA